MTRDRWRGMLDAQPFLGALAEAAARRRFARARAEDEDGEDLPVPDEAVALMAAADEDVVYRNAVYEVALRGGSAWLRSGPSGLAIEVAGQLVPLVRDTPVPLGLAAAPAELVGRDLMGRKVILKR